MSPAAKVIAALLLGAGIVTGVVLLRSGDSSRDQSADESPKTASSSASSESTGREASTSPATIDRQPPSLPTTAADPEPPSKEPPAKRFEAEPRDDEWAGRLEKRLAAATRGITVDGASVDRIECQTSVCRLEVRGESNSVVVLVEKLGESTDVVFGAESLSLSRSADPDGAVALFLTFLR